MNIVYTKIPKTASTYYCRLIEENYSKENGLKIYIPGSEGWRDPKVPIFPNISNGEDDRYKNVIGKYNISARHLSQHKPFFDKIMDGPIKYVTTLRNPLNRMLSHYYCNYIGTRSRYGNEERDFNRWYSENYEKLNPKDYNQMNTMLPLGFDNLMSYMLDYQNEDELTVESVKNKLDLILLTEKTEDSKKLLSKFLGIKDITQGPYQNKRERKNPNPNYKNFKIDNSVLDLFMDNNKMDYKLYEISLDIFNQQISEL